MFKAHLTRQQNGTYMLTALPAVIAPIDPLVTVGKHEAYMAYGEPLGVRHLCSAGAEAMFGVKLKRLESVPVEFKGWVRSE